MLFRSYLNGQVVFPTFFNLSLNMAIRSSWSEPVSSRSCFCWLYRASPSLAAKYIINLISVLTIWWCPCTEPSLVSLERVFAMTSAFSWQNSISLCPASFHIPRPNLAVTRCFLQRSQWHPLSTLAWKIPWTKEPGRLQSIGLLGVGHNWATSLSLSCIGEGNGNPLQCSCQENPRDGGAWWAAVSGVAQSPTRLKWLSSSSSSRCFLTSYFCIPVPYNEKDIFFWMLVLKGLVGLHRTIQLQLLQRYWLGHRLGLLVCLGNEQRSFCCFWDCIPVLHFGLFC